MEVSVVIPTHNRAGLLPRALDSVLTQSLPPCEVIIVDDGSTDGTAELVRRRYPECRLLRQPCEGVSSARNLGIRQARGRWIAFLDSDDVWLPDKLAAQQAALAATDNHRICHTEEIWIRRGVRVNAMKKHAKRGGWIYRDCLPRCVISPSSVLIRRDLFHDVGHFDETLPACEDYDLWLRICAFEPVAYVPEPQIVKYGGHADQLSRRYWGMDRFRVQALEGMLRRGGLGAADREATRRILAEKASILAQGAEKRGHRRRARYYRALQARHETGVSKVSSIEA